MTGGYCITSLFKRDFKRKGWLLQNHSIFTSPCTSRCCGNPWPHCLGREEFGLACPALHWYCPLRSRPCRHGAPVSHRRAAVAVLWARGITEVWGSDFFKPFLTPLLLWYLGEQDVAVWAWPKWKRKDGNCFSYVAGDVSVCVVSSDKRNNLEWYRLSELYKGACGEMIISLPFLLFLNFII